MIEAMSHSLNLLAQSGEVVINDGAAAGGLFAGVFGCVFGLIALALTVLWIWMLIDCLTRNFEGSEKIVWALVIIFLGWLGALIYLFVGRGRGTKGGATAPPA